MTKAGIFKNSPGFIFWIFFLLFLAALGLAAVLARHGFGAGGLSQQSPLGLYDGQYIFFGGLSSGLAATRLYCQVSGMKKFMPVIFWLYFCVLLTALLFLAVSLGRPERFFYIILSPNFSSPRFWVSTALLAQLLILLLSGAVPKLKFLMFFAALPALAVPAINGLLYHAASGDILGGFRPHSAILIPRFLTMAVSCGAALPLLGLFLLKNFTRLDLDTRLIRKLTSVSVYALACNIFFCLLDILETFYAAPPGHASLAKLLPNDAGRLSFVNIASCLSAVFALLAFILLILQRSRTNLRLLPWSLSMLVLSPFLEQGLNLDVRGTQAPAPAEILVTVGLLGSMLALFSIGGVVRAKNSGARSPEQFP
jgi:molybdopterin-containing oxidoreductase family membrane subunit